MSAFAHVTAVGQSARSNSASGQIATESPKTGFLSPSFSSYDWLIRSGDLHRCLADLRPIIMICNTIGHVN